MKLTINKTEEIELTEREEMIYRKGQDNPDKKTTVMFAVYLFLYLLLGICIGAILEHHLKIY